LQRYVCRRRDADCTERALATLASGVDCFVKLELSDDAGQISFFISSTTGSPLLSDVRGRVRNLRKASEAEARQDDLRQHRRIPWNGRLPVQRCCLASGDLLATWRSSIGQSNTGEEAVEDEVSVVFVSDMNTAAVDDIGPDVPLVACRQFQRAMSP